MLLYKSAVFVLDLVSCYLIVMIKSERYAVFSPKNANCNLKFVLLPYLLLTIGSYFNKYLIELAIAFVLVSALCPKKIRREN